LDFKESKERCILLEHRCRHAINEITGGEKGFIPIPKWKRGVCKQRKAGFHQMAMLAFSNPILLRCVRTRDAMGDAKTLEVAVQLMILATPIRLNGFDFGVQQTLHMRLEGVEDMLNIRLMLEKINPAKTEIVIDKANIIFIPSRGCNSWTPYIRMN
jgi:hypothetical protein